MAEAAVKTKSEDLATLPPVESLRPDQIRASEGNFAYNRWEVCIDGSVSPEAITQREFWRNTSMKMKQGDTIIALAPDGGWYAEGVVFNAGHNYADVVMKPGYPMMKPAFQAPPGALEQDFDISQHPLHGWRIVHRKTGKTIKQGYSSREDARRDVTTMTNARRI